MPFKKAHWPGLDEREYRMSQGHDSAAALIVDGRCVCAAAEERFNRKKHSGDFPISAIEYCLAESGLDLADIDEIVHDFDYAPYKGVYSLDPTSAKRYEEVFSKEALLSLVDRYLPGFPSSRVKQVDHHLTHAASAVLYVRLGRVSCARRRWHGRGAWRVHLYRARWKAGENQENTRFGLNWHPLFTDHISLRIRLQRR